MLESVQAAHAAGVAVEDDVFAPETAEEEVCSAAGRRTLAAQVTLSKAVRQLSIRVSTP